MNFIYITNLLFLSSLLHCRKQIVHSFILLSDLKNLNWDLHESSQAVSHKSSLFRKKCILKLWSSLLFFFLCASPVCCSDSPAAPGVRSPSACTQSSWVVWSSLNCFLSWIHGTDVVLHKTENKITFVLLAQEEKRSQFHPCKTVKSAILIHLCIFPFPLKSRLLQIKTKSYVKQSTTGFSAWYL